MSKQPLSATDQLFAEYKRTAPRLDLEFTVRHARAVPTPYALLQACIAARAAMLKDEPSGRNHGRHRATAAALTSQYRQHCARKLGAAYFAPLFTADEYAAIDCRDNPDKAYAAACVLSADCAREYADRLIVSEATAAYASIARYPGGRASLADFDQICRKVAA